MKIQWSNWVLDVLLTLLDGGPYLLETSPLICCFYMIGTFSMKELRPFATYYYKLKEIVIQRDS